jgi:hypothetical protein
LITILLYSLFALAEDSDQISQKRISYDGLITLVSPSLSNFNNWVLIMILSLAKIGDNIMAALNSLKDDIKARICY